MFCNKCGKEINPGAKFCQGCGNPVGVVNTTVEATAPVINNSPINTPVVENNVVPSTSVVEVKPSNGDGIVTNNPTPKKKSIVPILIIIFVVFFLFVVGIIAVVFLIIKNAGDNNNKFVCESNKGNITLIYDNNNIIGYTTSGGITYDLDGQKKIAEQIGIEKYLEEFNNWFEKNTSGTCRKELVNRGEPLPTNNNENEDKNVVKSGYKMVGKDKYGYVDVPTTWTTFYDVNTNHSIQFSYATTYIVTIDYVENPAASAKAVAETFYNKSKADTNLSNITMTTTTIGKEKYTAYKVGMYYIKENIYLYTYWFDIPGDSNLHYVAIEGAKDVEKYNDILDSYRLENN